jgi:hypothetical protein
VLEEPPSYYVHNIFFCPAVDRFKMTNVSGDLYAEICVECQYDKYKKLPAFVKLLDITPTAHIK